MIVSQKLLLDLLVLSPGEEVYSHHFKCFIYKQKYKKKKQSCIGCFLYDKNCVYNLNLTGSTAVCPCETLIHTQGSIFIGKNQLPN